MKYVCLGYIEDKYFADLTPKQQREFRDACFAYDEELQKGGHTLLDREVQAFVRSKPPDHLNTEDVKGFLTDLAVRDIMTPRLRMNRSHQLALGREGELLDALEARPVLHPPA